ncbi:hypothetical protein PFISCL1PPCAC_19250, partial [Pristionchus fissidentatus]
FRTMVSNDNLCLVCMAESESFHLGVKACRACTVFFRRTRDRKNPYECKNGGKCESDNFTCKKCRYDKFSQLLKEKKLKRCATKKTSDLFTPSTSFPSILDRSDSFLPIDDVTKENSESIIEKLRRAYRTICSIRRTTELNLRPEMNREDPLSIALGEYSLVPTTPSLMNESSRILISTLAEFATSTFEEFADLNDQDKWLLVRNFHKPFHIYDSCYRSNKVFPETPTRHFNSYTTFMDVDYISNFADSADSQEHYDDVIRMSRFHLENNVGPSRLAMKRFNPCEEEFLAMLAIQFWTIDMSLPASDEILELAEKYRSIVLRDLRKFYAEKKVAEYSGRIGELFCMNSLLTAKVYQNKRNFELFRLLDVFNDDSFVYRMQK